jgi:hypothetical protein
MTGFLIKKTFFDLWDNLFRIAQALHEVKGISRFEIKQKCFVPGKTGCVEHTAVTNAIINDAVKKNKQLFILSLD